MKNLGNIFLQALNNTLQQSNYLDSVTLSKNADFLMSNNPNFAKFNSKIPTSTETKAIMCEYSVCEGEDDFDNNDKVEI